MKQWDPYTRSHTEPSVYLAGEGSRTPRHGVMPQMVDQVCDDRPRRYGNQAVLEATAD